MPTVVKVVTPPAVDPVTVAEAVDHLRLPSDFTADNAKLTRAISAARRYCEALGKVTFVNTTFDLVEDGFPLRGGFLSRESRAFYGQFTLGGPAQFSGVPAFGSGEFKLPRAPLVSVASITYLDSNGNPATLDPSLYTVTTGAPGRVATVFGKVWPVALPQIGAVTVRFVAGYGPDATTVPENCKQAVLLYVGHLYENPSATSVGPVPQRLAMGVMELLGVEGSSGGYA